MKRVSHRWSSVGVAASGGLLVGLLAISNARGDDLVTLSGATYKNVRPVRVEPDGVTWQHAEGICKVDFADSPQSIRESYHYDAAKSVAYHNAQVQIRQQADDNTRLVLQEHEEKQRAQARALAAAMSSSTSGETSLILRRAASPAASAATRALGEQIAAQVAKQNAMAADAAGLGNAKAWSFAPRLGTRHPVYSTDAPNSDEYKAGIHHAPGGFTPGSTKDASLDTTQDNFYRPYYLTKTYYDEVDRAAAFANGVPLKR